MEIYLVGGAIRDQLLELPIHERDWVVVGATPQELLDQHFTQVGKDFPVFLHPTTKEEYALARTERKSGKGYTGFIVNADPSVTLKDDLLRRDLTINAIAQGKDGTLVDPYHGQDDLQHKVLRHVSPAFIEDPLRVLRVARFMARLGSLGFSVAKSTNSLMQKIAAQGELNALVPERVWKEWQRSLSEEMPHLFMQTLENCGALNPLFPEIQDSKKLCALLSQAAMQTQEPLIRFTVMLSTLAPSAIKSLCQRYKIPKAYCELAVQVATHIEDFQNTLNSTPDAIFALFKKIDAFRKPERFSDFLFSCEIITTMNASDLGHETREFLSILLFALQKINAQAFVTQGISGPELGAAIDQSRLMLIDKALNKRRDL